VTQPRRIEYVPIDDLRGDPRNPRAHESIEDVEASIIRFGFADPIVHDGRTGWMLAGHGRIKALHRLRDRWRANPGRVEIPDGIVAEGDQWLAPVVFGLSTVDDNEAAGLLMALNQLTITGGWIPDRQLALLDDLMLSGRGLEGIGFTDKMIADLRKIAEADVLDEDRAPTTGERLAISDVTFDDPAAEVHHGEVWTIGRHTLVVARLRDEHHLWAKHLTDEVIFAPYPDPYITTTTNARSGVFLMVQPSLFLAAHLIDKHRAAFPDEVVERQA
jgi:hypothetical protein